jgi:RNA polymerase sigma-70 factor, ECF subfamily
MTAFLSMGIREGQAPMTHGPSTTSTSATGTTDWPGIVREYGPVVWRTAYRLLGRDADAADCFQDAFVSAMHVAGREAVRDWPGLLQRLATARALDVLRRRMRDAGRHDAAPPAWDALPSGVGDPVEHAEAAELGERLKAALTELPPQQGEVFCLRCLNALSYDEIAAQLEMSIDAVGVALHRARGRLRELLAGVSNERAATAARPPTAVAPRAAGRNVE